MLFCFNVLFSVKTSLELVWYIVMLLLQVVTMFCYSYILCVTSNCPVTVPFFSRHPPPTTQTFARLASQQQHQSFTLRSQSHCVSPALLGACRQLNCDSKWGGDVLAAPSQKLSEALCFMMRRIFEHNTTSPSF